MLDSTARYNKFKMRLSSLKIGFNFYKNANDAYLLKFTNFLEKKESNEKWEHTNFIRKQKYF